jgi:nucleotide-binding universal stress UspA family protein
MKSILVPIDFSATANNAVLYALEFASQIKINSVVLFHVVNPIVVADPLYTLASSDVVAIKDAEEERLNAYAQKIKSEVLSNVDISTELVVGNLELSIADYCDNHKVDYIVMGITGASSLEAKLIGSNTLNVSTNTQVPLIIVPSNCSFKHIAKVTLLCDYKNVIENLPAEKLSNFLNAISPLLEVVHIDPSLERETLENAVEKIQLDSLIFKFTPEYKFSNRTDFEGAINDLVDENNIQLIISISKQKTWLQKLFNPNHTKQLAFHTKVPLMILHK